MKERAIFELMNTEKFGTYEYKSVLSQERLFEMANYRAMLVEIAESTEPESKFSFPSKPSWADKYK